MDHDSTPLDPATAQAIDRAAQAARADARRLLAGWDAIEPMVRALAGEEPPAPDLICPFRVQLSECGLPAIDFAICYPPDGGDPLARLAFAGRALVLSVGAMRELGRAIDIYTQAPFVAAMRPANRADGSDG
jgi:hypothetical protein